MKNRDFCQPLGNLKKVKLCRFELLNGEPGARSGLIFSGKVYETDGTTPRGMHEPHEVRLLPPVVPPSIRIFSCNTKTEEFVSPTFEYLNPGNLAGPQSLITIPPESRNIQLDAYFAVISASDMLYADESDAENSILGFSLFGLLRDDAVHRKNSAAAFDFGPFMGPVITTPDEAEDRILEMPAGAIPQYTILVKINQIEVARGDTGSLALSPNRAIAEASKTAPVRSGDIFLFGPICSTDPAHSLSVDDELTVASEGLGAITVKLSIPGEE